MRGEILHYDDSAGTGLISGDDGARYTFRRADLMQLRPVAPRMKVDFVVVGSAAAEVYLLDAAAAPPAYAAASPYAAGPYATAEEFTGEDLGLWAYFTKCMSKSFSGEGRARRKEYWSFVLFTSLIYLALILVLVFFVAGTVGATANYSYSSYGYTSYTANPFVFLFTGWGIVLLIVALIFLPAGITVSIRRLHDIGLSGWFYLLVLIPYLGGLFLFVCSLIPSERRVNKHGPIPKPASPY